MSKSRAEAFSDGVFAVAATLLVFSIPTPEPGIPLSRALLNEWPSYASYVISFVTILVIWVNHHATIDAISTFDRSLLFLNGLLLMTVAVIPFTTSVMARALQAGHDQTAAAVAYGIAATFMSFAFTFINTYAKARGLFTTPFSLVGFSLGQLAYPAATLIALFSYQIAIVIYAALAVFYAAFPLVREARLRRSPPSSLSSTRR
ncbi:MAG TPA: TMEM175 family protein [Candidatus Dormibacteraeota bacterium]